MSVLPSDIAGVARQVRMRIPLPLLLIIIPAGLTLLGIVVRWFGYAASVPDETLLGFPYGMCRWDCGWYVRLSETGYDTFPTQSMSPAGNWAFFPLMPMLVGLMRMLTQLPTIPLAAAISIAMTFATALVAWPLFERDLRAYTLFSAYLLSGPFSHYFTTFYTEPLFILLTTAVLAALQRRNYLLAGLLSGLLSATRIVGAVMAIGILVQAFADHRAAGHSIRSFGPALLLRWDIIVAVLLAPVGAFAYMLFLDAWIGDGLAFLHVQRAWARPFGSPIGFVWEALTTLDADLWPPTAPQQLALATIAGFALIGLLIWRRQWSGASFSATALTVPLFAGMASMLRFTAALAPLAILACQLLAANRVVFGVTLLGLVASGYWTTQGWIGGALSLV